MVQLPRIGEKHGPKKLMIPFRSCRVEATIYELTTVEFSKHLYDIWEFSKIEDKTDKTPNNAEKFLYIISWKPNKKISNVISRRWSSASSKMACIPWVLSRHPWWMKESCWTKTTFAGGILIIYASHSAFCVSRPSVLLWPKMHGVLGKSASYFCSTKAKWPLRF